MDTTYLPINVTGVPSDAVESTNIWRGHLAYDPALKQWVMFYNTGSGTEKLTYGTQNAYDYQAASASYPDGTGSWQQLTTSLQTLTNSRVNVTPGLYRVRFAVNVIRWGGTTGAMDIDAQIRLGGTIYKEPVRAFIGSYAYENDDIVIEYVVPVSATSYIDAAAIVSSGTPSTVTYARNVRVSVTKID